MAWFWRGAQSAFFYYVSCAPCANVAFERRRAKQKARAERETKELMKHASRHTNGQIVLPEEYGGANQERVNGVGAFTTNIYWQEDIELGPNPKKSRHRGGTTNFTEMGDRKEDAISHGRVKNSASGATGRNRITANSIDSAGNSSLDTLRPGTSRDGLAGQPRLSRTIANHETASRKRYQRPDELLWGKPISQQDWEFYARGRNPEINSLCPPVVSSKPANSSQALWMLQPPPPAKIMEGKQTPLTEPPFVDTSISMSERNKRIGTSLMKDLVNRPERIHICSLGERMTDLYEPDKYKTKPVLRSGGAPSVIDHSLSAETASGYNQGRDGWGSPTGWDPQTRSLSRDRRPQPIMTVTSRKTTPKVAMDTKLRPGFDPQWTFPRQLSQGHGRNIEANMDGNSLVQVDGYHSEPEPGQDIGISFQDFAAQKISDNMIGTPEAHLHFSKLKTRPPTSQSRSDSTSYDSLSVRSSASSLRPPERIVVSNSNISVNRSDSKTESQSLSALAKDLVSVGGQPRTTEDLEYWSGGREFRLGGGTV